MVKSIERIFNLRTLLLLNIAIILAAELAGGGELFYETGLIHAIAVFFIILSVSRIFVHYHSFDRYLEKLIHFSLFALAVLAFSHFVEFISYELFNFSEDTVFANVANFYVLGLLFIALGAEMFLARHDQRKLVLSYILAAAIVIQSFLISLFLARDHLISLETESPGVFIYLAIVLCVMAFGVYKIRRVGKLVSISRGFINYLTATIVLLSISAAQNILYELFEDALDLPGIQSIYIAHFEFYAALSLMFLSFVSLSRLPGIYSAIAEEESKR